jgi:hypothetical protein
VPARLHGSTVSESETVQTSSAVRQANDNGYQRCLFPFAQHAQEQLPAAYFSCRAKKASARRKVSSVACRFCGDRLLLRARVVVIVRRAGRSRDIRQRRAKSARRFAGRLITHWGQHGHAAVRPALQADPIDHVALRAQIGERRIGIERAYVLFADFGGPVGITACGKSGGITARPASTEWSRSPRKADVSGTLVMRATSRNW